MSTLKDFVFEMQHALEIQQIVGISRFRTLSTRESEVVVSVLKGWNNVQIAIDLNVSTKIITGLRTRAMKKLGCHNKVKLVLMAQRFIKEQTNESSTEATDTRELAFNRQSTGQSRDN